MKRVFNILALAVAIYGFAGWTYVAVVAIALPDTLSWRLTHLAPWPPDRYVRRAQLCRLVPGLHRLPADAGPAASGRLTAGARAGGCPRAGGLRVSGARRADRHV